MRGNTLNKPWSAQHSCPPRLNTVTLTAAILGILVVLDEIVKALARMWGCG